MRAYFIAKWVTMFVCASFCGSAQMPFAYPLTPSDGSVTPRSNFLDDKSQWIENIQSRTRYSTSWTTDDGRIITEQSNQPLYFQDQEGWQRCQYDWMMEASGWSAKQQDHPVFMSSKGELRMGEGSDSWTWGGQWSMNGCNANLDHVETASTKMTITHIWPHVTMELHSMHNSVKTQWILESPMESLGDFTIISQQIRIPFGAEVRKDMSHGMQEDDIWKGGWIITEGERELGRIQGTWCLDGAKQLNLAGYRIYPTADPLVWNLQTLISNEWLQAPERVYPIYVDPLITGPTSLYPTNYIPSCYIPDYYADSLLVTVPGQITVTGLLVTASFYADPFTTAIMADGAMYFSSSCGATTTFTVAPPNGELPGTAYLLAFDMQNPLMCCYPQSCSETSFYLRFHLGRFIPEGDCNYTYIYYTPFTQWPFTAYVEGHTVESFGPKWTIPGAEICSNQCDFMGTIRAKYGVPPYTFTHPWMTGAVVVGDVAGCDPGSITQELNLTNPDCPLYCPEFDEIDVFPPIITDACGNTVADLPSDNLNIKPAPSVEVPLPIVVCSGVNQSIPLTSCEPLSSYFWSGPGGSGGGDMQILEANATDAIQIVEYDLTASYNGCTSDTLVALISVVPSPQADFSMTPTTPVVGIPVLFDNTSVFVGSNPIFNWQMDGFIFPSESNTEYVFDNAGFIQVCLEAIDQYGCTDLECKSAEVITSSVIAPNIFTPNGDGLNDFLHFQYLEFFPKNTLIVFNRWGSIVFEREGYANDWNGSDLSDGVYYYTLHIENQKGLEGYVHLVR